MPSYFDHWFGIQACEKPPTSASTLRITDGDLSVDFTQKETGWALLATGWQPKSAAFKGGGYYANSLMTDGKALRHTAFDDVIESWRLKLNFYSADGMVSAIDELEELLKVRAPRYWTDRRYHKPVYIERSMSGETNTSYALLSQGSILIPQTAWDKAVTIKNGVLQPILLTFIRQPFWLGAIPGSAQSTVKLSAEQDWDYNLVWAEESTLPTGSVFCFVETDPGHIYAGGASEILLWNGTAWSTVTTTPVTLAADVTAAVILNNGDILFGESGRIIKLSGGTWSVETTFPTGQVHALMQVAGGEVYAGDSGRIVKRDVAGTWAEDDDLPSGLVYSLLESSSGRLFAGETGRILQTKDELVSYTKSFEIVDGDDDAEEYTNGCIGLTNHDLDFFQANFEYVIIRFQDVSIPQGAVISTAKIRFKAEDDDCGASGVMNIYCEDADNSAAPTTAVNDISNRTLTTAYKAWTNEEDWTRNQRYYTPELKTAVQEVIDRAGWTSGNALSVIFDLVTVADDRDAYSYDGKPGSPPELILTYSEARSGGETWEVSTTLPDGNVRSLLEVSNLILAGENGQILASDDAGETWAVADTTPTGETRALYDDGENLWAGDNGNILKSIDDGRNWVTGSALPTGYVHCLVKETATGDIRAGDSGRILILDASDTVTLGRDETDADEVFVANHHKTANLTHIKIDDGGVFTDIFPAASFPLTLLPAVPAVGDAVYFGVDTSLTDTGPICSVICDIATPAKSTTSYTLTWEYYNGAAWAALTARDETNGLGEVGVHGMFWKQPSDWATVAVDGDTGYWIRGRVSALTGTLTPPTQQNRDIYSAIWAYAEIDDAQTKGNVDSLIKLRVHNRSDEGGPGGSEPLLYQNRVVMGVKEVDDHEDFRAFLNFADEQNPDGVTVDVSVDADSATSIEADSVLSSATGRRVFFDAGIAAAGAGLNNLADRVEFELDTTIARDYYGTYKAFLRGKQTGGSAGEISIRLKIVSGSGGISSLTDTQVTQSTTDHEAIEFDTPITIPVSSQFTEDDIGDVTSIIVQISCAANDADLYLYSLFLHPTDLVWLDSEDQANTAESAVENGRRLVVDAIAIPKAPTRALVQKLVNDAFISSWRVDGNGLARLPAGKQVRLWFLSMRTASAGSSTWLSEPEACSSVTVSKTDRWLTGRGAA